MTRAPEHVMVVRIPNPSIRRRNMNKLSQLLAPVLVATTLLTACAGAPQTVEKPAEKDFFRLSFPGIAPRRTASRASTKACFEATPIWLSTLPRRPGSIPRTIPPPPLDSFPTTLRASRLPLPSSGWRPNPSGPRSLFCTTTPMSVFTGWRTPATTVSLGFVAWARISPRPRATP